MNLFQHFRFVLFLVSATIVFASLSTAQVGKPAPKIDIADWVSGEIAGENPFAGKSVVLEFWATWCAPCVEAIPHLNSLAEKYAGDKLVFVSISDEKRDVVDKFMANHPMKSSVVLDREGNTSRHFGVMGIPHTFLIDDEGILQWHGGPHRLTEELLDLYVKTGRVPPEFVDHDYSLTFDRPDYIIIRVESSNPNEEVSFETSYVFDTGDDALRYEEHTTPYEIKVKAEHGFAMFRRKTGNAMLSVTLYTEINGEEQPRVGATQGVVGVIQFDMSMVWGF